jgi:hypothetical protein
MRRLIQAIGPFALKPQIRRSPFESLACRRSSEARRKADDSQQGVEGL